MTHVAIKAGDFSFRAKLELEAAPKTLRNLSVIAAISSEDHPRPLERRGASGFRSAALILG